DYQALLISNDRHPELGQFKLTDERLGNFIGLAKLEPAADEPASAELGYMILPVYWGQGSASQVAQRLISKAELQPDLRRLFAIIDPANLPSRKILLNNGFTTREFK